MQQKATIRLTGKVQGVFFRQWAKQHAEQLDLNGLARNDPDGSLVIIVEGEEEDINRLIEFCREGPELAEVTDVQVEWTEGDGNFGDFQI